MRYKDDQSLQGYKLAEQSSDDMLLLTAVLGVVIGFVIAYLGKRGKQLWMLVWGIGLVVASIYLGLVTYFELPALLFLES